jgi:hypothetical protein
LSLAALALQLAANGLVAQSLLLDLFQVINLRLCPRLQFSVLLLRRRGFISSMLEVVTAVGDLFHQRVELVDLDGGRAARYGAQHDCCVPVGRRVDTREQWVRLATGASELAHRGLLQARAHPTRLRLEHRQLGRRDLDVDRQLIDAGLGVEHRLRRRVRPVLRRLDLAGGTHSRLISVLRTSS